MYCNNLIYTKEIMKKLYEKIKEEKIYFFQNKVIEKKVIEKNIEFKNKMIV